VASIGGSGAIINPTLPHYVPISGDRASLTHAALDSVQ
jgi:hypothetical protein